MDSQLRLDILRELLSCVDNLCAWRYDKEMILQSSNSKQAEFFDILFSISLCKQQALAHCTQNDTPILLTSTIGLTWIAAPEYEADELCHVYVIGPVFTANASERSILQMAQDMDISASLRTSFLEQIKTVPIVMIPAFCRYGAMLHFCYMTSAEREAMGSSGRAHMKEVLDKKKVVGETLGRLYGGY